MTSDNSIIEIIELFEFSKIMLFLIGILVIYLLNKSLTKIAERLTKYIPSQRLLVIQMVTILIFLIYITGFIILFYKVLSPSKELMIAISGSIAVALGLSLKDIVSSLVSGLILLFNKPFQVGDRVSFSGDYGEIESIGLITVKIKTLNDDIITIPNSRFFNDTVSCSNSGNMHMMIVNNFYVDINSDLKKLKEITEEIIITNKYSYLKERFSINFEETLINNILAIKMVVKCYVLDVKYEKAINSDITSKIQLYFSQYNIKRPVINLSSS